MDDKKFDRGRGKLLFYGVLLYIIIYYSQLGLRIPVLGKIRIELLLGSALLLVCMPRFIIETTYNEDEKRILYPIYFFFAACFISIPNTIAGYHSIDCLIDLLKSFSIFFMILVGVNTENKLKVFIYVLLFMAGLVIVEPFLLLLSGKGCIVHGDGLMRLHGVTGLFAGPNDIGGFTAGSIPLIYFVYNYEKSLIKKLFFAAIGVIAAIVIIKTESRSAMVGMLSACLYIWFASKKKILSFAIIIILLLIGWAYLDDTTKERYLSVLDSKAIIAGEEVRNEHGELVGRGSMKKRYQIIIDGLILFSQRPITGYGIGGYQVARIEKLGRWQVAHNAYSQCLAELGIVGFIPFVMIIVYTYSALNKAKHSIQINEKIDECEFIYKMTFAFQGYLFVHLCLSMFGHTPYQNYWWIPAAISLVILRILRKTGMEIKSH